MTEHDSAKTPDDAANDAMSVMDTSEGADIETRGAPASAPAADSVAPGNHQRFLAEVVVMPRGEVADPQGAAIEKALRRSAEDAGEELKIAKMRVGKVFRFRISAASKASAEERVREIADRVLANPNVESFTCTIVDA